MELSGVAFFSALAPLVYIISCGLLCQGVLQMSVNFLCVCGDSSGNTAVPPSSSPTPAFPPSRYLSLCTTSTLLTPLYYPPLSLQVPLGLDSDKDSSCLADLLSAGNKLSDAQRSFMFHVLVWLTWINIRKHLRRLQNPLKLGQGLSKASL